MSMTTGDLNWDIEALSPSGRSTRVASLHHATFLANIEETNNGSLWDDAYFVPDVLGRPGGIWNNLMRGGQEEAFCYAGKPDGALAKSENVTIDIPKNKVLIVFLDKFFCVTKWRWCEPDTDNPCFPLDHKTRFEVRLWPE